MALKGNDVLPPYVTETTRARTAVGVDGIDPTVMKQAPLTVAALAEYRAVTQGNFGSWRDNHSTTAR